MEWGCKSIGCHSILSGGVTAIVCPIHPGLVMRMRWAKAEMDLDGLTRLRVTRDADLGVCHPAVDF